MDREATGSEGTSVFSLRKLLIVVSVISIILAWGRLRVTQKLDDLAVVNACFEDAVIMVPAPSALGLIEMLLFPYPNTTTLIIPEHARRSPNELLVELSQLHFQLPLERVECRVPIATDVAMETLRNYSELHDIDFAESAISDAGVAALAPLQQLARVNICNTNVTGWGLRHWRSASNLEYLALGGTRMTDREAVVLEQFAGLYSLELSNTRVGDFGLRRLTSLRKLKFLFLSGTEITDNAMSSISQLGNLVVLDISDTGITNEGVRAIARLSHLEYINLSKTKISDEVMMSLNGLAALHTIRFDNTLISDGTARALQSRCNLRTISLVGTTVSNAAAAELVMALPNTVIVGPTSNDCELNGTGVNSALKNEP